MPETARWIGGFIRWLFKACKTNLKDEIEGNFDPSWGGSYDTENFIIGITSVIVIIVLVLLIAF